MGDKDHLPDSASIQKKQRRDMKRIVSSVYQSPPPVLTRGINQIGILAKTTAEVRESANPMMDDINDLTDNIQTSIAGSVATITVALDNAESQFQRLQLDDATASITEFIIDLTNLAKNKAMQFILDIETIFTGTPTITFKENGNALTVAGLPAAFGDTGTNEYKFQMSAIDTPTVTSYDVINGVGSASASNEIRDGDTYAIVIDAVPTFAVFLNNIQKYSISNTRVDYADLDLFGVTSISFEDTVDAATGTVFTQNQNDFTMNIVDNADTFEIDFNSQIGLSVDLLRTRFYSNTPNTVSAAISLYRDDPSPGVTDALGDINFDGNDSAGNFTTYADIVGGIESPTTTAEIGRLSFRLQDSGSMQQVMRLTLDEMELTNLSILLDEISLPSNPAANQGLIYLRDVAATTTPFFLDSAGVETSLIGGGGSSNSISQGDSNITVTDAGSGLIVTTVDGSNVFQIQATRADYQDLDVYGINRLSLRDESGATERAAFIAGTVDVSMTFAGASDLFFININSINTATFGPSNLILNSGAANTTSAALRLYRNDPSPTASDALGSIHFDGEDDAGNFTTYATWIGGIESAVSASEIGSMVLNLITASGDKQILEILPTKFAVRDAFIELDELSGTPSNPAANFGLIYLKDNGGGVTTPFFLDSAGAETSMIAGGGDAVLANSQTWTGINTYNNATNGIVMTAGAKLEFENASVSNLEIHAESNLRDPGDMSVTTRNGLEIDLNTGAVPDTEVFHIGDGQAAPWMLMDDNTVRFNTAAAGGVQGHQMFLSRNDIPTDGDDISEIFAQARIGASTWLKFAFIRMSALDVDATAANNEGQMRLGVVSNNSLNTGIYIEGDAGVADVKLGFYQGATAIAKQVLGVSPTTAQISTVLEALGLTSFT